MEFFHESSGQKGIAEKIHIAFIWTHISSWTHISPAAMLYRTANTPDIWVGRKWGDRMENKETWKSGLFLSPSHIEVAYAPLRWSTVA